MNGHVFREKREALGLSQSEMAKEFLITQPRLAQIEGDYKDPSVAVVRMAARRFGCTADELIFGGERQAPPEDRGGAGVRLDEVL